VRGGDDVLGDGDGEAEADEMERHRDERRLLEPRERLESMLKDCRAQVQGAGAGSGLSVWISDQRVDGDTERRTGLSEAAESLSQAPRPRFLPTCC
jgi:hypothetical protein